MNFSRNNNLKAPETNLKVLNDFMGVDYTVSKLDASPRRAVEMSNFIHRDGKNQKRYGWKQFLDIKDENGLPLKINGFWELVDKEGYTHIVIHAGKKIFEFVYGVNVFEHILRDITTVNYIPPTATPTWPEDIKSKIFDDKSFGIVRGERLYIFCGIYLVFGKWNNIWELRAVRDNVDTYIPTTTTNISPSGEDFPNTRSSFEEVNMMCSRRRNKLIGEKPIEISLSDYPLPTGYWQDNTYFGDSLNQQGFIFFQNIAQVTGVRIVISAGEGSVVGVLPIENGTSWTYATGHNFGNVFYNGETGADIYTFLNAFLFTCSYSNENELNLTLAFGSNNTTVIAQATLICALPYQLDATNISKAQGYLPTMTHNGITMAFDENGKLDLFNATLEFNTGILYIGGNFLSINKQPNITVEFTTERFLIEKPYEKIESCQFGVMFGMNDVEHLFVSGNPNFPNMDWHTSDSMLLDDNYQLANYENLTYFGDLNYAVLGEPSHAIKSYSLLEDGMLAIHKEYSPRGSNMFVRSPVLADVTDSSGNVVYDFNGKAYQKIYYSQFASNSGEGCISSYANGNLAGDKLILSNNGIFGIELSSNLKTNERFAKERSRLINARLTKHNLKEAVAIVYENRYYLYVGNGTVYVADSRYKTQPNAEMPDTFSYEYWVLNNIDNLSIWFIHKGKLCFGTYDGRLCSFEEETHADNIYERVNPGGVAVTSNGGFVYSEENYPLIQNGTLLELYDTDGTPDVFELVYDLTGREMFEDGFLIEVTLEEFTEQIQYSLFDEDKKNNYVYVDSTTGEYGAFQPYTPYKLVSPNNNDGYQDTYACYLTDLNGNIMMPSASRNLRISKKLVGGNIVADCHDGMFKLLHHISYEGLQEIYYYKKIIDYDSTANTSLQGLIHIETPVSSYWFTPIMALGTVDYSKTLTHVTVVPEAVVNGEVTIGLITRKKQHSYETQGASLWNDLQTQSFNNFTFETSSFAKSFTKKLKIKNFNFLQLSFKSDNRYNCMINAITLTYIVSRINKGVR